MARQIVGPMAGQTALAFLAKRVPQQCHSLPPPRYGLISQLMGPKRQQAR